jgi:UDP-galactopyranose mutase
MKVVIVESRNHIGGNAHSYFESSTGIEVHQYGAHLFHTSNALVWDYVNRFTRFTNYEHRVFTKHRGNIFPMPINLGTINQFFGAALSPSEAKSLLSTQLNGVSGQNPKNFEEKAISLIGEPLYEAFIKGYTAKQWQTDPKSLPSSVISRLPVRFNYDNRYFNDTWQGLPEQGYASWFSRMVQHKNIEINLQTDFLDDTHPLGKKAATGQLPIIYTGPMDRYFNSEHGDLSWRTLDFETSVLPMSDFQGTSVMNFADEDVPYTRIIEFKHFHPERREQFVGDMTVITKEFSRFALLEDDTYYPVNSVEDREKLNKYRELVQQEAAQNRVFFGGRLGTYKYLDMHMAIASALAFDLDALT